MGYYGEVGTTLKTRSVPNCAKRFARRPSRLRHCTLWRLIVAISSSGLESIPLSDEGLISDGDKAISSYMIIMG